jgi:hypothetical protein
MIYLPNEQETNKQMDRIMIRTTTMNQRQSSKQQCKQAEGAGQGWAAAVPLIN